MSTRRCLFRFGSAGPVRLVPEVEVLDFPGARSGKPSWLLARHHHVVVPKSGPWSDRLRLCPDEQAAELDTLAAESVPRQRHQASLEDPVEHGEGEGVLGRGAGHEREENDMKKIEVVVGGKSGAVLLATDLIRASIWFEVIPLPFDNYRIISRDEPQVRCVFTGASEFPVRRLQLARRDVLEEAWRRAEKYRGPR